jgi:hypothetical protein
LNGAKFSAKHTFTQISVIIPRTVKGLFLCHKTDRECP